MIYLVCQGINFLLGKGKDHTGQQVVLIAVGDQLFQHAEVFLSFAGLQVGLGDFLDELIHSSFSHQFQPLLATIVVVEAFFLYLLSLFLLEVCPLCISTTCQLVYVILDLVIVLFQETTVGLLDYVELAEDVEGVLERHRTMEGLHDVYHSSLGPAHPIGEIHVIGHSGTEHDESDVFRQHDDSLLPHHSSLLVVDVVHFVENDPLDVSDHLCPPVEVVSQDLGSHDDATRLRVHTHVTSHYAH